MYPIGMNAFTKFSTALIAVAAVSCAADDPLILEPETEPDEPSNTVIEPTAVQKDTTTTTSIPQSVEIFEPVPQAAYIVMAEYTWMQQGTSVAELQKLLEIEADGVYGPSTRRAHVSFLESQGVTLDGVPKASSGQSYSAPASVDGGTFWPNVERWRPAVTEAVYAWGGDDDDVHRFLRIMQCESAGLPDAKNPNSSASGLMQQLARYWPERSASAGVPGADIFDPYANIWVSSWLALASPYGGWQHWVCR